MYLRAVSDRCQRNETGHLCTERLERYKHQTWLKLNLVRLLQLLRNWSKPQKLLWKAGLLHHQVLQVADSLCHCERQQLKRLNALCLDTGHDPETMIQIQVQVGPLLILSHLLLSCQVVPVLSDIFLSNLRFIKINFFKITLPIKLRSMKNTNLDSTH